MPIRRSPNGAAHISPQTDRDHPESVIGINRTFVLLHLIFVFSSAGRTLGIDGLLHRRFPHTKLF